MNKYKSQEAQALSKSGGMCNHLGSTAFVTDGNATVTQGFLYAPFGEITTEYAPMWQNSVLPNYTFNAKELDEESGMYYYEARYYQPPVFTSRDPMFEKYFWMSPYAYCANNPMKYVDPTEMKIVIVGEDGVETTYEPGMTYDGNDKFTSDAIAGLNFLYNNPEGEKNRVADIVNAENTLTVMKGSGTLDSDGDGYSSMNRELRWNNDIAAVLPDGTGHSPIIGLAHEIDHASISIPAWDLMYRIEESNPKIGTNDYIQYMESVSSAYMDRQDPMYETWENHAVKYENFIGNMYVKENKLATYQRSSYCVPQGLKTQKVSSIFSITY